MKLMCVCCQAEEIVLIINLCTIGYVGRNLGIATGNNQGYQWNLMLDGNAFLFKDALDSVLRATAEASEQNQTYVSSCAVHCAVTHLFSYPCCVAAD